MNPFVSLFPIRHREVREARRGDPARWIASSARQAGLFAMTGLGIGALFLAGCQAPEKLADYQPLVARFYLEVRPGEAGVPAQLPVSGVSIPVNAKPVIVEYDIANAEVAHVDLGSCLMLQLTPAAARDLYRLSVSNVGRRLVLFLNDAPMGARRIEQAMPDGTILVFVETPDAGLAALVARLKRTSAEILAAAAKKK